jgi:negative regulator of genetic competence, sporulation and motility
MAKVKNWAWDCAEKKLETVVEKVETGLLTHSQAIKQIQDSNENWGLLGFDNITDVIDFVTDIKVKYSC